MVYCLTNNCHFDGEWQTGLCLCSAPFLGTSCHLSRSPFPSLRNEWVRFPCLRTHPALKVIFGYIWGKTQIKVNPWISAFEKRSNKWGGSNRFLNGPYSSHTCILGALRILIWGFRMCLQWWKMQGNGKNAKRFYELKLVLRKFAWILKVVTGRNSSVNKALFKKKNIFIYL